MIRSGFKASFNVGDRYRCEISCPEAKTGAVNGVQVEWEPAVPAHLTRNERREYQRGMLKAMQRLRAHFKLGQVVVGDTLQAKEAP